LGVRLAYRRMWSATADRLPGEPESGTNFEATSLTANAAWRQMLFATAGVRYNLLLGGFDDAQLALRARVGPGRWVTAEYSYLAPTFDGDSIWNIFSTGA